MGAPGRELDYGTSVAALGEEAWVGRLHWRAVEKVVLGEREDVCGGRGALELVLELHLTLAVVAEVEDRR